MDNYNIINILEEDVFDNGLNPLLNIAILSNELNNKQIKELLKTDLYLSYSNDKCVLNAVNRIKLAKENNEKIFIAGDYDADGICGTSIMKDVLDIYGVECGFYIPDRFSEGYGLNENRVYQAYEKGYSLIITVDNGVSAYDAINLAKSLGMDVIVTDHHVIDGEINADIVVHPDYMDEKFNGLCGAGVALQISRVLIGNNDYHTALSCIATIGDMVPLWNENRNIVKHGLRIINEHKYKEIDMLLDDIKEVNETDIAFKIVPKLNAMGRLPEEGNPNNIVRYYFLGDNISNKIFMKNNINNTNKKRQDKSNKMFNHAINLIEDKPFIVIKDKFFNEGIVGLVAGKLSNQHNKPSIVFTEKEGVLKGSGRSIKGFDLQEFLKNIFDKYLSFGGHSQAVGLSINVDDYEEFINTIYNEYKQIEIEEVKETAYLIDENKISVDNVEKLYYLSPYGQGFKMPEFAVENFKVKSFNILKGLYPKYILDNFEAISFSNEKIIDKPKMLIGNLSINTFRNVSKVSMIIKDIE
ncbi:MAG: DHH family phosphoesterase [Erysipelotrichaceae bacterium]|nr:DHHA1 domain-containing protein [Bacillota bacterium]